MVRETRPAHAPILEDADREGQQLVINNEASSSRTDIGSLEKQYKKDYIGNKYPVDEYEKRFSQWEEMLTTLFIKKR